MADITPLSDALEDKAAEINQANKETVKDGRSKNRFSRRGPGMKKGQTTKKKLEQQAVNLAIRQRIMNHADEILNAQLSIAKGAQVLMVKITERDHKGKVLRVYHEQVENPELIRQYLDGEYGFNAEPNDLQDDPDLFYYMVTQTPNNQAIEALFNRALGKAPDKIEIEGGFFSQPELVIRVVESKHESIDIGEDGQIIDGTNTVGATGSSDKDPEPPASS